MNNYRSAAAALAACAASLSLAACTAGITTAGTAMTSPAAPTRTAAAPPAHPAAAARMLEVSGEVGSFPVPAGAKVVQNIGSSQETIVIFRRITPARVSSFYAQALPRAGYTVTANSVVSQSGNNVAYIQFTGHGVKGNIGALSKFTGSIADVPGLGHKNVTTISLVPK